LDLCSQSVADEDKEGALGGEESVADYAEFEAEPKPVDHIHRVSWRKGTKVHDQSPLLRGSGAWSALTNNNKVAGNSFIDAKPPSPQSVASSTCGDNLLLSTSYDDSKYNCAWDALFSENVTDDDTGVDQLLDLFETEMADEDDHAPSFSQQPEFETAPLTQRGQVVADSIEEEIASDPTRLQSIEAVCPNWRDNIRFALAQRGPAEIRQALERVRHSMDNLQSTKKKVATVWKRQEVVLQLFEMSLSASLSRLDEQGGIIDSLQANSSRNWLENDRFTHARTETLAKIFSTEIAQNAAPDDGGHFGGLAHHK